MKKVFVSHNFNDREVVNTVQNMTNQSHVAGANKFVFAENVSAQGDAAIDREIRRTMKGCDTALFAIGNNNHNSPWINREVELAKSAGKKVVVTQLPNTTGGAPKGLTGSAITPWSSNDLTKAL